MFPLSSRWVPNNATSNTCCHNKIGTIFFKKPDQCFTCGVETGPSKSSLVKIHIGLILRSCCLRNGLKLSFFKRSFRSSNLAIASALPCFGDLVAAWFEPGYNLRIYFCLGFIFLLFSKS